MTVRSNVIVTACYLPGIVGYSPVAIKGFTQSHFAFSLDAALCPGKIQARNINKLERIQQRATGVISKNNAYYGTHIEKLNLLSLLDRRCLFDVLLLLFFYNVINEYLDSERYSPRGRDDCVPMKNYAIGQTFPN